MEGNGWHRAAPLDGDATWRALAALVARGLLLHGSQRRGLDMLEPRAPIDFSIDEFSKSPAVYATEDPSWAIGYAIRAAHCRGMLNACFHPGTSTVDPATRRIFLSYARGAGGQAATAPGVVYAVPADGFIRMPSYRDLRLGMITECQWINPEPVPVMAEVPVSAQNLPLVPLLHDAREVAARSAADPQGFPWLG